LSRGLEAFGQDNGASIVIEIRHSARPHEFASKAQAYIGQNGLKDCILRLCKRPKAWWRAHG
jgi:hypothetical protein